MDDIEMRERGEQPPPEDEREAETAFDNDDDRDNEVETNNLELNDDDDREDRGNDREVKRNLSKRIAGKETQKTNIKKRILFDLGYKINKGDGKKSEELFRRLKLTESKKTLEPNGMTFDGVKIIILGKDWKYKFSENVRFRSKIYDFEILAREAKEEHDRTAVANIEDQIPDVFVDDEHARSILRDSSRKLNERISDREDRLLKVKLPTLEEREEGGITVKDRLDFLKTEQNNWVKRANRVEGDPRKEALYETIVEVAKLKADQLRLEANLKPESGTAQSILEEETENNPLTRSERFKKWSKENLGGISVIAISVAGIITTIVMGMKTVVVSGANAASKFGKFLAKLAEKAGPVLGALLNLAAGLLKLGAKGVSFIAENLWILAVLVAYALWDRAKKSKNVKK